MNPLVHIVTTVLSILVVAGQVMIFLWLGAHIFFRKAPWSRVIRDMEDAWSLKGACIVALVATLGSLFYSEIAHFTPCTLCWYQRILMYPQVLLLGTALWKKDKHIADYSIVLSAVGAVIAGYHYLLQRGVVPELPCSVVGISASCSQRFVMTFGYITIPLMALTAFVLLILFMVTLRRKKVLGIF